MSENAFTGQQCYNFNPAKKITRVEGTHNANYTGQIKFFDSANAELLHVRPGGSAIASHVIGPDEELIGVYGVKHSITHMTSFGFLVKVT